MTADIEARRAARRAAMPTITALVEQYAEFSPTVVWAEENGITVGKKPDYTSENAFQIPHGYRLPTIKEGAKR